MTLFVSIAVSLAVGFGGGLYVEYRYTPSVVEWVIEGIRKVAK